MAHSPSCPQLLLCAASYVQVDEGDLHDLFKHLDCCYFLCCHLINSKSWELAVKSLLHANGCLCHQYSRRRYVAMPLQAFLDIRSLLALLAISIPASIVTMPFLTCLPIFIMEHISISGGQAARGGHLVGDVVISAIIGLALFVTGAYYAILIAHIARRRLRVKPLVSIACPSVPASASAGSWPSWLQWTTCNVGCFPCNFHPWLECRSECYCSSELPSAVLSTALSSKTLTAPRTRSACFCSTCISW